MAPDEVPRRVVISGIGPITAIGISREDFLQGLNSDRDGTGPPDRFSSTGPFATVAECRDFAVQDYLESEKTYLDRCSELALASCALALDDADIDRHGLTEEDLGIALGTAFGCVESLTSHTARVQEKGVRFGSPMIFTHAMANSATALCAIEYNIKGPGGTFCTGDVAAAGALEFAHRVIAHGQARFMLAGGCDALTPAILQGIQASALPDESVPGEGGCMFVLESAENADERGVKPIAELRSVTVSGSGDVEASAADSLPCVRPWGHAFGASVAIDVAALLLDGPAGEWTYSVCTNDDIPAYARLDFGRLP